MAQVVTPKLELIIRNVRALLNQPKAENSRFSDADLIQWSNDAVQQIFLTVNEAGEGQFDTITSPGLNVTSGTEVVTLPTDCFAVKAAYWVQGTVKRRLEYRNSVLADVDSSNTNSGQTTYEPYYFFRGNSIVLRPAPGFTSTDGPLILEYTKYPTVLVYGADTMDTGISPLFRELIESYVVAKAKFRDDLSGNGSGYKLANTRMVDLFHQFKHQLMERSKAPMFTTPFEPI